MFCAMPDEVEIAVEPCSVSFALALLVFTVFHPSHEADKIAYHPVSSHDPTVLDDAAHELHSLGVTLEVYLVRMQFKTKFLHQPSAHYWNKTEQFFLVRVNQSKIVRIPLVPHHLCLDEMVEWGKEEIGKYLAWKVAYLYTFLSSVLELRLVWVELVKQLHVAYLDAVFLWSVHHYHPCNPFQPILVLSFILGINQFLKPPPKQFLVDVHEETLDITGKYITLSGVVF